MNISIAYVTIAERYFLMMNGISDMKEIVTHLRKTVAAILIRLLLKVMPNGEDKKSFATWVLQTYVPKQHQ